MGDVRRGQSAILFNFAKKQDENATSQGPIERRREHLEKTTPAIITNQVSIVAITEESVNRNQKFLTASVFLTS